MKSSPSPGIYDRRKGGTILQPWFLLLWLHCALAGSLSDYVRQHQMLYYPPVSREAAERARRSAATSLYLTLPVFGRRLSLELVPDTTVLAPDVAYLGPSGASIGAASLAPLYTGWVAGVPGSRLFGALLDGVFDGTIVLPNETLYVERAELHVDGGPDGHSFVYRSRDIVAPGPRGYRPCGVGDGPATLGLFEATTTPRDAGGQHVTLETFKPTLRKKRDAGKNRSKRHDEDSDDDDEWLKHGHGGPHALTMCSMYLETDPVLWQYVFKRERGSLRRTEAYLQALAGGHVQAVNQVYERAVFDGRHHHHGIQFQLQRLTVTDDRTCLPNFSGRSSRLCFKNAQSQAYLSAHSSANFDDVCLAFALTYHDFEDGVMGLAWIGAPWAAGGRGVCARHAVKAFRNSVTGVTQKKAMSLNSGIVSLLNFGQRVHPLSSQLTLAHEIGHTMGSPHDGGVLGSMCLPNDAGGNFLMFYMAQDGQQARHRQFSNCSVSNISRVLDHIVEGHYFNCFQAPGSAFCGNRVVEEGEQCDCGFTEPDCFDVCCWPRQPPPRAGPRRNKLGCQRRPGARCSPSEGPCCDPLRCAPVPAEANHTCRPPGECTLPAVCDGESLQCPPSPRLTDLTPCGEGSRVCQAGRCTGSACLSLGVLPCELKEADVAGDRRLLCRVGCRTHAAAPCRLRAEWRLGAGDTCDGAAGVCDALLRCRPLSAEGPLRRLEALLAAGGGVALLTGGVTSRWWTAALLAVLLAVGCALLLRCVALHIPSSNPNKPAPRSLAETLREPGATFFGLHGGGDLEL